MLFSFLDGLEREDMDKEGGGAEERKDPAASLLDPANLFAYWPRGDTGTSAATNGMFYS